MLITSDSKSNTLLSGLSWHLLVRLRLLGSLYSHTLLTLTKSSKSKNQVVHEQKFKDLLSSTWQVSVERRVLDLESEVMRGLGFIPTGCNIFVTGFFFSHSEASDANIGITANKCCVFVKTPSGVFYLTWRCYVFQTSIRKRKTEHKLRQQHGKSKTNDTLWLYCTRSKWFAALVLHKFLYVTVYVLSSYLWWI